ncbi:MAG TPA: agmatine deiminase family protein [Polyangiales bacterium]|jgi:agmatine deiminase|nr:agmatine deiminase family protein [Polyangiales bacterium]
MESENNASAAGYAMPAEWSPHRTCYTAWPAYEFAWGPALRAAQSEFCAFVRAWSAEPAQEPLTILVAPDVMAEAQAALGDLVAKVELLEFAYGDVWVRDTAPLFVKGAKGLATVRFRFNGWGEKYLYPHDDTVAVRLAERAGVPSYACDFVLEGGALEVDGLGTCLTTRSCLQNPNRGEPVGAAANRRRPTTSDAVIAKRLHAALGITQVVWIDGGLANDHTDGHIDNIARFVSEGTVVCMQAQTPDDPNRATLDAIFETLQNAQDARGRSLKVVRIPSPGRVLSSEGAVVPASYMNFIVGNKRVLMPTFGTPWDAHAVRDLQAVFPRHEVVGCSARAILEGGGTFHCMTQQEPLP